MHKKRGMGLFAKRTKPPGYHKKAAKGEWLTQLEFLEELENVKTEWGYSQSEQNPWGTTKRQRKGSDSRNWSFRNNMKLSKTNGVIRTANNTPGEPQKSPFAHATGESGRLANRFTTHATSGTVPAKRFGEYLEGLRVCKARRIVASQTPAKGSYGPCASIRGSRRVYWGAL